MVAREKLFIKTQNIKFVNIITFLLCWRETRGLARALFVPVGCPRGNDQKASQM